jgi:pimeloyl-ACP methyl ester carboxylesterase
MRERFLRALHSSFFTPRISLHMLTALLFMAAAELHFEPYTLTTFDGRPHPAEKATLTLLERAGAPRTIDLAVVRLRTANEHPNAPIVFLAPGPGIAANVLARVPVYFRLFDRLRENADVILLDARGEGMSKPNLDSCPAGPIPDQPFASYDAIANAWASSVKHCGDYWRSQGVDLGAYTTDARADDVDALRRAIGAQRLQLLAFSYGTELALDVLRRHPGSVERLVLAGTADADDHPNLPSTNDVQLAKLRADLPKLAREALARAPIDVTIDGKTDHVGTAALQLIIATQLSGDAAMLPALLTSVRDGDVSIVTPLVKQMTKSLATGVTLIGRAIDCAAPTRADRVAVAAAEAKTSIAGNLRNLNFEKSVCMYFGSRVAAPRPPLVSDVPILFVSGALDANAPPFYAERVRFGFRNSKHVVVENGFHETLPDEKVQSLVADFLAGHDVGSPSIKFPEPRLLTIEEARAAASRSR